MDLTSTARTLTPGALAGQPISINVGGQVLQITDSTLLTPAERLAALRAARDVVVASQGSGAAIGPGLGVLAVHCLHALGEQLAAVQFGSRLLAQWPQGEVEIRTPVVPPLRTDLDRPRSTDAGSWLRQMLGEYVATHASFSSYFQPPMPARWAELLRHPDHGAGIERRYLLSHVLADRVAPVQGLHRLKDPQATCNHFLWRGLIETMAAMAPATPTAAPIDAAALLAMLPVAVVTVVDVGASALAQETEPYAALVEAGRARVTGFEPDAVALDQLRRAHPDNATHEFLPHFVGDGGPAVFHETAWSLTASLLPPQRSVLDRYHQLGELVQVKARHEVQTVRLDDVIAGGGMDLLKIDVQGAERLVFDGAAARLDECLVVWTEVEMVPLYCGQPLFGDIDARLRQHGLQFLCFTGLASRALASWPRDGLPAPRRAQQLWADAIYVPAPERIAGLTADAAARLALLAHHVVDACDLCHAALQRFDELTRGDFAPRYRQALQSAA